MREACQALPLSRPIHVVIRLTITTDMDQILAQIAGYGQKDRATAYQSLLAEILSRSDQQQLAAEIHLLVENVVQDSVGVVVGRHVLTELVKALGEGAIQNIEVRKRIVEDTLSITEPRIVSYEEQVRVYDNFLGPY